MLAGFVGAADDAEGFDEGFGDEVGGEAVYDLASDVLIDYYQPISKHWSFKKQQW